MRTITQDTRNGPVTVTTDLTLAQAAQTLTTSPEPFVQDLLRAYRQFGEDLTTGRANWLLIKAQTTLNRQNKPKINLGDLSGVRALLNRATEHGLKCPKIRLQLANGTPVILSYAKPGTIHTGKINVTAGPYPAKFWGRIDSTGRTTIYEPEVLELLRRLAQDPAGVASEYGKATGQCAFCDHPLTDDRSLYVGYGPVCASHFDLPWGEKPNQPMLDQLIQDAGLSPAVLNHGRDDDAPLGITQAAIYRQIQREATHEQPIDLNWLLDRAQSFAQGAGI